MFNSIKISKLVVSVLVSTLLITACNKEETTTDTTTNTSSNTSTPAETPVPADDGKGIGPVKTVTLGAIDSKLVADGKKIFDSKCLACHSMESRKVGPSLGGVTERRKPEWIMNMILNPTEMTQKDAQAKKLLAEYLTQMANQNTGEDGARALLEYFRDHDAKKGK